MTDAPTVRENIMRKLVLPTIFLAAAFSGFAQKPFADEETRRVVDNLYNKMSVDELAVWHHAIATRRQQWTALS